VTRDVGRDARAARDAVATLAGWSSALTWADVPTQVQDRLLLALADTLGVTIAGARLPENRALVQAWPVAAGAAPVFGAGVATAADQAAWLNAVAAVRLELDEGNKFARGHPATQASRQ